MTSGTAASGALPQSQLQPQQDRDHVSQLALGIGEALERLCQRLRFTRAMREESHKVWSEWREAIPDLPDTQRLPRLQDMWHERFANRENLGLFVPDNGFSPLLLDAPLLPSLSAEDMPGPSRSFFARTLPPSSLQDNMLTSSPQPATAAPPQPTLRQWLFDRSKEALATTLARVKETPQQSDEENWCLKHWALILGHLESDGQPPGPDALPRIATFAAGYFATADHPPRQCFPPGDVEIDNPDQMTDCRVLCATMEELSMAQCGLGLPLVPFIYVPSEHRTGQTYLSDALAEGLASPRRSGEKTDAQNYDPQRLQPTISLPIANVLDVLRGSNAPAPFGSDGSTHPHNFLSLQGELMGYRESEVVERLNLRFLCGLHDRYIDKIQGHNGVDKQRYQPAALVDAYASRRFQLVAQPGATSGWHADIINGTWLEVVRGYKTWTIVDTEATDDIWDDYFAAGIHWEPNKAICKTFLLAPGDTLVMLPAFTPHLVGTIGTPEESAAHIIGGQVLPTDPRYLSNWYRTSKRLYTNPQASNEPVPRQIPDLLNVLREDMSHSTSTSGPYTRAHLDELDAFIAAIRPHLSCDCPNGKCGDTCPCLGTALAHTGGCTAWCHNGRWLNATRECVPAQERKRGAESLSGKRKKAKAKGKSGWKS